MPTIPFKPDQTHCPICQRSLCVLKTRKQRKVIAIGIGTFIAHETTKYCPQHPDNKDLELANGPSLGYNHYHKVVSRIKDAYHELDVKN